MIVERLTYEPNRRCVMSSQESDERLGGVGGCVALFAKLHRFTSHLRRIPVCRWQLGRVSPAVEQCTPFVTDDPPSCGPPRFREPSAHCFLATIIPVPVSSRCSPSTSSAGRGGGATASRVRLRAANCHPQLPGRLLVTALLLFSLFQLSACCSTRAQKRPEKTFSPLADTRACADGYRDHFCLNNGTCFNATIGRHVTINCVCAVGFNGHRCEYKYLTGDYNKMRPARTSAPLELANLSVAAPVVLMVGATLILVSHFAARRRHGYF